MEELLNDLSTRYRSRESTDDILFEIQTIRQKLEEGAGDYGHRTQVLLKRLLRAHDADVRMPEDAKVYLKEKGERETLEKYLLGLEVYLQHQVRSKSPKDLRTAIEKAIDMERRMSARRKEVKTQDPPTEVLTLTTEIAIITGGEIIMEGRESENGAPTIAVIITPALQTREETRITTEAAGTEMITMIGTGPIAEITVGTVTIGEAGRAQKIPQPTAATATLT